MGIQIKTLISILISCSFIVLTGCDSEPPKSKIKNPLSGQVDALKKAKEVEGILLDAAEKQRKSIEDMSK